MMTGRLGAVDFRAPVDDRWFEDHLPGPRITTESGLPGRSAAFTALIPGFHNDLGLAQHRDSSTLNSSSRTRLLDASTNGSSHGEPGSMKLFRAPGRVRSGSVMRGGR